MTYLVHQPPTQVDRRFARLRKGINAGPASTGEDFATMRALGFNHVRLTIEPTLILDETQANRLNAAGLADITNVVNSAIAAGLVVLIDLHSYLAFEHPQNVNRRLEQDVAFRSVFAEFWQALATHFSSFDPDFVFLEILNEPVFVPDVSQWLPIQAQLAAAIRVGAPNHTIVATAANYSQVDALVQLSPLPDPNVIYGFHFYEPMVFTHQAAEWLPPTFADITNLPYPSTPTLVLDAIAAATTQMAKDWIAYYGQERWNVVKIQTRLNLAVQWAKTHGVPLLCSEFGVYDLVAPPASRYLWTKDVRLGLEANRVAWSMWHWDRGFGLIKRENNQIQVDRDLSRALGLADEHFKAIF